MLGMYAQDWPGAGRRREEESANRLGRVQIGSHQRISAYYRRALALAAG